jgi:hypothetical protein
LPFIGRAEFGLAFRTVDAANGHLIELQLARGFGDDGLNDGDSLHAAGRALGAARRRVGEHGDVRASAWPRLIQKETIRPDEPASPCAS